MDSAHEIKARECKRKVLAGDLLTQPVHTLVQENPELIYDYEKLRKNQQSYWLDQQDSYSTEGVRGIWLYGPPGTGKSKQAIDIADKLYGEEPYWKSQNKWWDGYTGQKVVLLDDLDFMGG